MRMDEEGAHLVRELLDDLLQVLYHRVSLHALLATCTLFALCVVQDVCSDSEWELIRKIPNGAAAPDLVSQCSGNVSSGDREWFPIRWGRSLMCVN